MQDRPSEWNVSGKEVPDRKRQLQAESHIGANCNDSVRFVTIRVSSSNPDLLMDMCICQFVFCYPMQVHDLSVHNFQIT
jgi:hypothetical protein